MDNGRMLTMYDSVTLTEIPHDAQAVAGYTSGRWPTWPKLAALFPHAHRLSIAVTAEQDADCLDVEPGDATNAQAPAWVRRQQARGVKRPVVYTSLSNAGNLLGVLAASGVSRDQVRLWTAHYTGVPHVCSAGCGLGFTAAADATQYTNRALGRNLDASLVTDSFFGIPVQPASPAVRRARLRGWVVGQRQLGRTWAWLKHQPKWRLWRNLGGK